VVLEKSLLCDVYYNEVVLSKLSVIDEHSILERAQLLVLVPSVRSNKAGSKQRSLGGGNMIIA
jgi:hypothetical protein